MVGFENIEIYWWHVCYIRSQKLQNQIGRIKLRQIHFDQQTFLNILKLQYITAITAITAITGQQNIQQIAKNIHKMHFDRQQQQPLRKYNSTDQPYKHESMLSELMHAEPMPLELMQNASLVGSIQPMSRYRGNLNEEDYQGQQLYEQQEVYQQQEEDNQQEELVGKYLQEDNRVEGQQFVKEEYQQKQGEYKLGDQRQQEQSIKYSSADNQNQIFIDQSLTSVQQADRNHPNQANNVNQVNRVNQANLYNQANQANQANHVNQANQPIETNQFNQANKANQIHQSKQVQSPKYQQGQISESRAVNKSSSKQKSSMQLADSPKPPRQQYNKTKYTYTPINQQLVSQQSIMMIKESSTQKYPNPKTNQQKQTLKKNHHLYQQQQDEQVNTQSEGRMQEYHGQGNQSISKEEIQQSRGQKYQEEQESQNEEQEEQHQLMQEEGKEDAEQEGEEREGQGQYDREEKQQNIKKTNTDQHNVQTALQLPPHQNDNPIPTVNQQQPPLHQPANPQIIRLNNPQPSHPSSKSSSQSQQDTPSFDLDRYRLIQTILQHLLKQLKMTLKYVKSDNITQGNINHNKNIEKNTQIRSRNKSLIDIMHRRDIIQRRKGESSEKNNRVGGTYMNNYDHNHLNNTNQTSNPLLNNTHHNSNSNYPSNPRSSSSSTNNKHPSSSYHHPSTNSQTVMGNKQNNNKMIKLGLGNNLGNSTTYDISKHTKNQNNKLSTHISQEQRQRLIINRDKINEILAASSTNFSISKNENIQNRNFNQKANPIGVNITKRKSNSFFIRQSHNKQTHPHQQQLSQQQIKQQKDNLNDKSQQYGSKQGQYMPGQQKYGESSLSHFQKSRKIIKSSNFSKVTGSNLNAKNSNSYFPDQINVINEVPSSQSTIQKLRKRSFILDKHHHPPKQAPLYISPLYTLTPLLKIIKKYLQIIAQGKIDDVESLIQHPNEALLSYNNLNELIHRRKLFKTALYYERASVIAGICYGYLIVTHENGQMKYQQLQYEQQYGVSSNGEVKIKMHPNNNKEGIKQSIQTMKQQTKQVLKYMINLTSFSLNNCKLLSKTIQDNLSAAYANNLRQAEFLHNQTNRNHDFPNNSPHFSLQKTSKQLQTQKQISKRNIETIKLNLQYMQETFLKLFGQENSLLMMVNLNYSGGDSVKEDFGESFKNVSKLINKNSMQETFYTLLQYFAFYLCLVKRQRAIPFLAVAPNPYLDPVQRYTLVIDFIQVFCHGTKRSKNFIFRPYSQHFLQQMSQYYDIVVISDALPQQIDKIIDILDSKQVISHRLYKYHMAQEKNSGKFMKSLSRIGRDLSKVILLDTQKNRLIFGDQQQQEKGLNKSHVSNNNTSSGNNGGNNNTIFINQWRGSKNDFTLAELCSILISIVVQKLDCVKAAHKIDSQMRINQKNGIKFINFGLNLKDSTMQQQEEHLQQCDDGQQWEGN